MSEEKETDKIDSIVRELSSGVLISSYTFGKLNALEQTKLLSSLAGKTIVFRDNFSDLENGSEIAKRFYKGEDVSLELEFNGITVTDEQLKALETIKPLLNTIKSIGPAYTWREVPAHAIEGFNSDTRFNKQSVTRNGYNMKHSQIERIWDTASKYWANTKEQTNPATFRVRHGKYDDWEECRITDTNVRIGCQSVSRSYVEWVAKELGYKPNV